MSAQTYEDPVRWIVVDDGPEPSPAADVPSWEVLTARPSIPWKQGQNTQARNLLAGLNLAAALCPSDLRLVIVEDDDSYATWWLERCAERLEHHDLIGESHSLYIHRETMQQTEMGNARHASLCATAMKGPALETFREVLGRHSKGIDMQLWKAHGGCLYRPDPRGVTGYKGWPGRPGIGVGHRLT